MRNLLGIRRLGQREEAVLRPTSGNINGSKLAEVFGVLEVEAREDERVKSSKM